MESFLLAQAAKKRPISKPLAPQALDKAMAQARAKSLYDPDWFCNEILRCPNDPWQSEMLNAIADLDRLKAGLPTKFNHEGLNRFSVVAFHGVGKTHFLAVLMHWYNFTRKGRIPCTGPKEKSLRTRLWPEFRKVLHGALVTYRTLIEVQATYIQWGNDIDWCALIEAASQPENLQGYHDDNLCFLVEEASGVPDEMFQVVEGALTTPNAILVDIGNPTRTSGEFWASHNKPGTKELYYRKQIKHSESSRVSPKWVADMIRKYGRSSPVVKVRVFGEFVDMAPNQLYAMEWLERARNAESKADGSHPKLRISVDVADGGIDESVFTVTKHYLSAVDVVGMVRKSFPAATAVADATEFAIQLFEVHGGQKDGGLAGDDFVVDGIGVGAGMAAELTKRGYNCIKHKGGETADDPVLYRNRRTQVFLVSRDFLRADRVAILEGAIAEEDWDDFVGQMLSIKTHPGIERIEEVEPKTKMLMRGEKSPDMPDSFSMAFATRAEDASGIIEILTFGHSEVVQEFNAWG